MNYVYVCKLTITHLIKKQVQQIPVTNPTCKKTHKRVQMEISFKEVKPER